MNQRNELSVDVERTDFSRPLSLEAARECLLAAIGKSYSNPIMRTGIEPLAHAMAQGVESFKTCYRSLPPGHAVSALLAGSRGESLYGELNQAADLASQHLDNARFEGMLALCADGQLAMAPAGDRESFINEVKRLAANQQAGSAFFSTLNEHLASGDSQFPEGEVSNSNVFKTLCSYSSSADRGRLNKELNDFWTLIAKSKDGVSSLYISDSNADNKSLCFVSDIGAAFYGKAVFDSSGSRVIDGAYLSSISMPTHVNRITSLDGAFNNVMDLALQVIRQNAAENLLPVSGNSAEEREIAENLLKRLHKDCQAIHSTVKNNNPGLGC